MKRVTAIIIFVAIMGAFGTANASPWGEPDDSAALMVNRPVNTDGLTGLIKTTSAYTQPKHAVVLGLSGIGENYNSPDVSFVQGIATVTVGLTDQIEAGVKAQAVGLNLGSSADRETGIGDTDLFIKWRITQQYDTFPALAIGVAYTFPTGDEVKGTGTVKNGGARLILAATSEKVMPAGFVLGIYVDGQIVYNDEFSSDKTAYSDKYGRINAGVLFSLVDDRRLQGIVEYNYVGQKKPTVFEQDSWSILPGLRYVTERLNVTVGVQFVHPADDAIGNGMRGMGTISYRF
jgi:hypothetical protein